MGLYQLFLTYIEGKPYKRRNVIKLQMLWRFSFRKLVLSEFLTIMTLKGIKCRNHSNKVLETL